MTPEQEDAFVARYLDHDTEGRPSGFAKIMTDEEFRLAIRAAYAQGAAQESQWREAVLNELIVAHIYTKEHDTNPRKAIQDAITWNCQVALDPAVSSDARKLIAQERERCAKVCEEHEPKDYTMAGIMTRMICAAAIRRGEA